MFSLWNRCFCSSAITVFMHDLSLRRAYLFISYTSCFLEPQHSARDYDRHSQHHTWSHSPTYDLRSSCWIYISLICSKAKATTSNVKQHKNAKCFIFLRHSFMKNIDNSVQKYFDFLANACWNVKGMLVWNVYVQLKALYQWANLWCQQKIHLNIASVSSKSLILYQKYLALIRLHFFS